MCKGGVERRLCWCLFSCSLKFCYRGSSGSAFQWLCGIRSLRENSVVLPTPLGALLANLFKKCTSAQASTRAKLKHISQRSEKKETNQDSLSNGE